MKTIWLAISVILFIQFIACKAEDATVEESVEQQEAVPEPMPWTFLTAGIYHNNATVIIGQDPGDNPNKGQWLNFDDNGTYEFGLYANKEGQGTWFYSNDNSLLELTPGGDRSPTEWRVMSRDDNLILVGTSKYGNNAQQLRYNRREGLPSE